jgi:hypothetical protein
MRPGTEGHADYTVFPLTFTPPPGYRVRILRLYGDLVSWPCTQPGQSIPPGTHAGVLLSIHTKMTETSPHCDYCAGNALLYIQDGVVNQPVRTSFDLTVNTGVRTIVPIAAGVSAGGVRMLAERIVKPNVAETPGLLESGNKLYVKVSQWMNTTGVAMHMEPTFTVVFRFEPAP